MNIRNLIMTPTGNMTRDQWLDFRQPLTHIKKFIDEFGFPGEKPTWEHSQAFYDNLKNFFERSLDWQKFIFPTIGASEISSIMGLNPYKANIELYFEKVGLIKPFREDNAAMFWGRELEEQIAQKWQYWDGNAEGMIANFNADNKIRRCRRTNHYIQNKAFPWIFISLDRIINRGGSVPEGCLECKTISGFAANMWENGIPPMYVAQLQTQIAVSELPFGEMALLTDGRTFDVLPFDQHTGIIDRIKEQSKKFFDLVKMGCEHFLLWTYATSEELKQFHYSEIEKLAPDPDGSDAYKNYLSNRYKDQGGEVLGGIVELELAKQYYYHGQRKKLIEADQQECANKIKAMMKDASVLDFGHNGKVTWKANEKGTRVFNCKVKVEDGYVPEFFKVEPPTVEEKVLAHRKQEAAT